jgi:hypothetical protein
MPTATRTIPHWIDGKPVENPSAGGESRSGDVHDPSTGAVIATVGFAST